MHLVHTWLYSYLEGQSKFIDSMYMPCIGFLKCINIFQVFSEKLKNAYFSHQYYYIYVHIEPSISHASQALVLRSENMLQLEKPKLLIWRALSWQWAGVRREKLFSACNKDSYLTLSGCFLILVIIVISWRCYIVNVPVEIKLALLLFCAVIWTYWQTLARVWLLFSYLYTYLANSGKLFLVKCIIQILLNLLSSSRRITSDNIWETYFSAIKWLHLSWI